MNNGTSTTSNEVQYWAGSSWATLTTLSASRNNVYVNAGAGSSCYFRIVAVGPQGRGESDWVLATF
jgi:hypothetical protein